MTTQEAIETLKLMQGQIEWDYPMEYAAAVDMAVDALEKQIPEPVEIKPAFVRDDGIVAYKRVCPDCGHELEEEDICPNCGKWIRWDE